MNKRFYRNAFHVADVAPDAVPLGFKQYPVLSAGMVAAVASIGAGGSGVIASGAGATGPVCTGGGLGWAGVRTAALRSEFESGVAAAVVVEVGVGAGVGLLVAGA
jgi:hypothetical protein